MDKPHIETGPGYRLTCWCSIGHDHTFEQWQEHADLLDIQAGA